MLRDGFDRSGEAECRAEPRPFRGSGPKEQQTKAKQTNTNKTPRKITPTAFKWRDPKTIPPRPFVMGQHYSRGYANSTAAPGGVGKSSLIVAEILQAVTGRRLVNDPPRRPLRAWYIGEDPQDELERRFIAAMKAYGIDRSEVEGRLFIDSFRDLPICVWGPKGPGRDDIDAVETAIKLKSADIFVADPLASTHALDEKENHLMNLVYREWNGIAHRANCAIELVRHTRKTNGQSATVDDARGGSSQTDATRETRTLAKMTEEEAKALNVDPETRWRFIRVFDAKQNMAPPPDKSTWWELTGVFLDNATEDPEADNQKSDNVQVVMPWKAPPLFDGISTAQCDDAMRIIKAGSYRENAQAKEWVGNAIAPALGLSLPKDKHKLIRIIKTWCETGMLNVVERPDKNGDPRPFIALGEWEMTTSENRGAHRAD